MQENKITIPYIWLVGLSMLGFLATDMYLPAFDIIRQDLQSSSQMIGWSLSVFLFGMAGGQLIYGPLTNRFGKRSVLTGSLILFCLGSIICTLYSSIEFLLAGRLVQAIGACGSTIIWQSFVIEKYDSKTSQRIFATVMPLVALSPALAPLLGAMLESQFGWQSIFYTLVLIGIILIIRSNLINFSKTHCADAQATAENAATVQRSTIKQQYIDILKSKTFTGNMLIYAACSAAFFAWLTGSPFAMASLGYSGADIGLSYVPQTIAFIVGGYGCRMLLNKFEARQILPWLLKLFISSVVAMFLIATSMELSSMIPLLTALCFLAMANGAIYPLVVNNALAEFKENSACAAGLMNFLQLMLCVIASALVSALSSYGVIAMTAVMAMTAVIVVSGHYLIVKKEKVQTLAEAV